MRLSSSAEIITEQSTPSIYFRQLKIVDHAAVTVRAGNPACELEAIAGN
jgi:hypothetical protein